MSLHDDEMDLKDGDIVDLPRGWTLEIVSRDDGTPQGFVIAPDRKESASLNFALSMGTTSGDREIPIPRDVLRELEYYEEYA